MVALEIRKFPNYPLRFVLDYATAGSSGIDLFSADEAEIQPMSVAKIHTGTGIKLAKGYEAQIRSRSGLALKHQVIVLNSPATIDNDYDGEICVILYNLGSEPYRINIGDKIAQLCVVRYERCVIDSGLEDELCRHNNPPKTRGVGGFGSTGF